MEKFVCIHGHFYQPPRENPWLEAIEIQDSADPYHDWNERIAAECYGPNAASRILEGDADGTIVQIVNNYARISFDFGPTLLAWMKEEVLEIYGSVLEADRDSQARFSGHGSAMAQAYNHAILPLANRRDKETQVIWGIRDFEFRFGRKPEGMWLPETAVDLESLEVLAENGIRFTVLAPHQAGRTRKKGEGEWRDVSGSKIDPRRAYELTCPSGRKIALFFYDGPVSRAVAFEDLLRSGEAFSRRIEDIFDDREGPQLAHIATDGETYGHHHRFGDMALAFALHRLEAGVGARLTNYGEFLERFPPDHEVEILENTSWSCVHGVERWRSDCGCNGGQPGWNQTWRTGLRESLDWLRDEIAPLYERKAGEILRNPWEARNAYISVILGRRDRNPEAVEAFLSAQGLRPLSQTETVTAFKLLEMQRHAQLMYTSCGWFFDDLSGIETVQVILYAAKVLELARDVFGINLEPAFLERLSQAKSNVPSLGEGTADGSAIYDRFVKPARVHLDKVAAHYAVSSLFEAYGDPIRVYGYRVEREVSNTSKSGDARLVSGRARVTSEVTRESGVFGFAVLHMGDHNVSGGVRPSSDDESFRLLEAELAEAFLRADFASVIRILDNQFQASVYSLRSLFRDEQRKILNAILESRRTETDLAYRQIYERQAPLMRFLSDLGQNPPKSFLSAARFALEALVRQALATPTDWEGLRATLEEARFQGIELESQDLEFLLKGKMENLAERWQAHPTDLAGLRELETAVRASQNFPFPVNLWAVQNIFYRISRDSSLCADDPEWRNTLLALGERLRVKVG